MGPATSSLARTPALATSRLDPQVQDLPVKNHFFPYIRYIYRKFTQLLATRIKTGKLVIEGTKRCNSSEKSLSVL